MLWKECMKSIQQKTKKQTYKDITIATSYEKAKVCKLSKNDREKTSKLLKKKKKMTKNYNEWGK